MSDKRPRNSGTTRADPGEAARKRLDELITGYRSSVSMTLEPLVRRYHPAMLAGAKEEYRKMLELSTKMSVVAHACTEIAGYPHDARRKSIGCLFGACCFLADSFIDDFGEETTREYLIRLERLLTEGWFEIRNDRELLFYIVVSRLFAMRDVLHPTVRQAILQLFIAQTKDVELRRAHDAAHQHRRRAELKQLKQCARNRSGHAILVLSSFLLPQLPAAFLSAIFTAGALIMYIDDHGDCYTDLQHRRVTFMNQVKRPERTLKTIFLKYVRCLSQRLPKGKGRDLLIAFLTRYYLTRLEKHRQQRLQGGAPAWAVYE